MNDAAEAMSKVLEALQTVFAVDLISTKQGRAVTKGRCLVHEAFEWCLCDTAYCRPCLHQQRETRLVTLKSEIVYVEILK